MLYFPSEKKIKFKKNNQHLSENNTISVETGPCTTWYVPGGVQAHTLWVFVLCMFWISNVHERRPRTCITRGQYVSVHHTLLLTKRWIGPKGKEGKKERKQVSNAFVLLQ
jgi:hypothetical protein